MTPQQLLEETKARFYSLLHDEDTALNALLKQALGAYQDFAGYTEMQSLDKPEIIAGGLSRHAMPDDFLARVMVKSKQGDFIVSNYDRQAKELVVQARASQYPLSLSYFINLRDADLDNYELPSEITGVIADYLEVLISIPNSERNRRIAIQGNLDTSDIPSEQELRARKLEQENRMKDARSALPYASIHAR